MSNNEIIMDKYYKTEDLVNGIDGIPPINEVTLRNLRLHRKIRYTKLGKNCVYKRSWILEYLEKNEVATK
ncbi:MAG: hypothetical protein AB7E13_00695 [Arcobacteraceae bacterium]|jgi:hypothetical protein